MNIVLTNASTILTDDEVAAVAAPLQAQSNADLVPAWGVESCTLEFLSKDQTTIQAGGYAIVVLDDSDQAEALGYHDLTAQGKPLAKVFARSCAEGGEDWRTCTSHELLEMLCDPNINTLRAAVYKGKMVTTIQEVCDPVEGDSYVVAGVPVSNFILPSFYGVARPVKYDFLGRLSAPMSLDHGGYMSIQDDAGNWTQIFGDCVTTWKAKPPQGSRRERLRAGHSRWRKSSAI